MKIGTEIFDKEKAEKQIRVLIDQHVKNWFEETIDFSVNDVIEECVKKFLDEEMKPVIEEAIKQAGEEAKKLVSETIKSAIQNPKTIKIILKELGWEMYIKK